jgi:hypothetical protein
VNQIFRDHGLEQLPKKSANPEFYDLEIAPCTIAALRPHYLKVPHTITPCWLINSALVKFTSFKNFKTIINFGLRIEQLPYRDFLMLITITLEKAVVLASKETATFLSHKKIFAYAFVSIDDYPMSEVSN